MFDPLMHQAQTSELVPLLSTRLQLPRDYIGGMSRHPNPNPIPKLCLPMAT
jgi:hypothetical protein